ncbi:MAG TPA: hypothetical protein VMZ27_11345, partial [Candidatus Saccharimonadales bacterium]|nr:hypothetical protein [Candidatus Saccharimonadales bacterium]
MDDHAALFNQSKADSSPALYHIAISLKRKNAVYILSKHCAQGINADDLNEVVALRSGSSRRRSSRGTTKTAPRGA